MGLNIIVSDANSETLLMDNRYSMAVQWSDEDQLFLVTIPEFADRVMMPCTHGKTREEAIRNGEEVIEMYLEAWATDGELLPEPLTRQVA
jgi:predicted RNase H-like HicB family nuclease